MKDIIADIYNKVLSFFQSTEKEGNSKEIASNRLKLVLMQDRTNLDTAALEKMRIELIEVISRYVEIDKDDLGLNLAGEGDSIALMLNIPVLRAKTSEEIAEGEADENAEEVEDEYTVAETESEEESVDEDDDTDEDDDETEDVESEDDDEDSEALEEIKIEHTKKKKK